MISHVLVLHQVLVLFRTLFLVMYVMLLLLPLLLLTLCLCCFPFLILVLPLSLLLCLLLFLLPFLFLLLLLLLCLPFLLSLFYSFSSFHSSLSCSICSPSFFFLGFLFSSSAVSSYCLRFQCFSLFACSASPVFCSSSFGSCGPSSWFFGSALLSSGSALFSSLGLLCVLRSYSLLSRGPSGVTPSLFFVFLFPFFFFGCWGSCGFSG